MENARDILIAKLIRIEGGYSDHPADSGGKTKYGITHDLAKSYNYHAPMAQMPIRTAMMIYNAAFWRPMRLDDVVVISPALAEEILDTGVNMGCHRAIVFLQRSLNALNDRGTIYPDLKVDGDIGDITIGALQAHMKHRKDATVLLRMLNSLQGAFYIELAEKREKDEAFIYGWFKNRVLIP